MFETDSPMITSRTADKPVVVHLLHGLYVGGIETLCLQLLKHAPSEVCNILFNLDPKSLDMLTQLNQVPRLTIHHQDISPYPRYSLIYQLWKKFKAWKPQAIVVYPFGLHIFVGIAARLAGVPIVVVHAGNPPPGIDKNTHWKWRFLIGSSRILNIPINSCSHTVHEQLASLMQLPQGSLPIPNGCDVSEIATRSKSSRNSYIKSEQIVIGMVARLNTIKDQTTLIEAFGYLNQTLKNLGLWLIGEGPERNRLERLCIDLNIRHKVKFWGERNDVPELLGKMDIYAFSTTADEGFWDCFSRSYGCIVTNCRKQCSSLQRSSRRRPSRHLGQP